MKPILTSEEKKYLRMTSNYLNSLGLSSGIVDFEIDSGDIFDIDDIQWKHVTHFSNNYRAEISEVLLPILKKILTLVSEKYYQPDLDYINYESITVEIDTQEKVVTVTHNWNYTTSSDPETTEWEDDDEDVKEIFKELKENPEFNGISELTLKYDGGGDSGYIEGSFDSGESVSASIENWCYERLENMYGGWEINEGSSGNFEFDLKNNMITLYHTSNYDESESKTVFEESFSK